MRLRLHGLGRVAQVIITAATRGACGGLAVTHAPAHGTGLLEDAVAQVSKTPKLPLKESTRCKQAHQGLGAVHMKSMRLTLLHTQALPCGILRPISLHVSRGISRVRTSNVMDAAAI